MFGSLIKWVSPLKEKYSFSGQTHGRIISFNFQNRAERLIIGQGKYMSAWMKYVYSLLFAAGHSWIAYSSCSIVLFSVEVFKTLWTICEHKWEEVVRCFLKSWVLKKFPSFEFRMLDNALLLLVTHLPPLLYNLINVSLQEKAGTVWYHDDSCLLLFLLQLFSIVTRFTY